MRESIHPKTRIGHAHLRVSDLRRATDFYHDVLGFDIMMYGPETIGVEMAFLSAGGYHHHIGLNTFQSAGGTRPSQGHTGLYHIAILYPDRPELAKAVKRVLDYGYTFTGGEDDGLASGSTSMTRTATVWSYTTIGPGNDGPTRRAGLP